MTIELDLQWLEREIRVVDAGCEESTFLLEICHRASLYALGHLG
jgi:hypothetical protein